MKHSIIVLLFVAPATIADPFFGASFTVLEKDTYKVASGFHHQGVNRFSSLGLNSGVTDKLTMSLSVPYGGNSLNGISLGTQYKLFGRDNNSIVAAIKYKHSENEGCDKSTSFIECSNLMGGIGYDSSHDGFYTMASLFYQDNDSSEYIENKLTTDMTIGVKQDVGSTVYLASLIKERSKYVWQPEKSDHWFVSIGFIYSIKNFTVKFGSKLPIDNRKEFKTEYSLSLERDF